MINDGRVAVLAGVTGNVLAMLTAATILREPPGSAIRPMHVPIMLIQISIGTAIITWPFAIWALASRQGHQTAQGIAGMILGVSPWFVGFYTLDTLLRVFGYTLKP